MEINEFSMMMAQIRNSDKSDGEILQSHADTMEYAQEDRDRFFEIQDMLSSKLGRSVTPQETDGFIRENLPNSNTRLSEFSLDQAENRAASVSNNFTKTDDSKLSGQLGGDGKNVDISRTESGGMNVTTTEEKIVGGEVKGVCCTLGADGTKARG